MTDALQSFGQVAVEVCAYVGGAMAVGIILLWAYVSLDDWWYRRKVRPYNWAAAEDFEDHGRERLGMGQRPAVYCAFSDAGNLIAEWDDRIEAMTECRGWLASERPVDDFALLAFDAKGRCVEQVELGAVA